MKMNSSRRLGLLLASAALVITSNATLADSPDSADAASENTNIVLASASTTLDKTAKAAPHRVADNPQLEQALASVMADNISELDKRLANRKSLLLAADL